MSSSSIKAFASPVGHLVISLYRSLTCHGGQSGSKDSKWILILLRSKIVKHFQKKFFLRKTVQIGRDCIDTVFLTAKWFNLKSKILEIFTVSLKKSFFLKIQGYDQRRTEILGFYCLLTKTFFYETLIIKPFSCAACWSIIKKFILKTEQASKYQKSVRSADDGFGIQEQEVSPQIIPAAVV